MITPELIEAITVVFGPTARSIEGELVDSDFTHLESTMVFAGSPPRKSIALLRENNRQLYRYAVLPSPKTPRWMVPIGDAGASFASTQIYFPHKWAPKTLKALLAGAIKIGCGSWLRKILVASKSVPLLEKMVRDVTGERHIRFALSLGRHPAVRKLTVQAMRPDGNILGYIKLPLTDVANERVQNEAKILERLWKFPKLRPHIPRLLFAGEWNGRYALFQSPLGGEVGPVSFRDLHKRFLATLRECHSVEKSGQVLVESIGTKWRLAASELSSECRDIGQEALRRSGAILQGKGILYNVAHGDFAPWNTRVDHNELRLFDWESATWEGPSSWDIFHFRVQTTSAFNERETYLPFDLPPTEQASFMLYLLSCICQYLVEKNPKEVNLRQEYLRRFLNGDEMANASWGSVTL